MSKFRSLSGCCSLKLTTNSPKSFSGVLPNLLLFSGVFENGMSSKMALMERKSQRQHSETLAWQPPACSTWRHSVACFSTTSKWTTVAAVTKPTPRSTLRLKTALYSSDGKFHCFGQFVALSWPKVCNLTCFPHLVSYAKNVTLSKIELFRRSSVTRSRPTFIEWNNYLICCLCHKLSL